MIIKFNIETGLMYIHFATGISNIQMPTSHEDIFKFVAKANKEQIVGYEIESAIKNIKFVLNNLDLTRKQKLAIAMSVIREKKKQTQKEFSTIIHVSEGTYKSIERGEHNISFDTLDIIFNEFQDEPILHQIFRTSK